MLKGYRKLGCHLDSRLPITLPILQRLISAAPAIIGLSYQACLFQAMCSLAFFAFLRVGEMTIAPQGNPPLQFHHFSTVLSPNNQVEAIKISFGNFNHSYNVRPFSIVVSRQLVCCPVQSISNFCASEGIGPAHSSWMLMVLPSPGLISPISFLWLWHFVA